MHRRRLRPLYLLASALAWAGSTPLAMSGSVENNLQIVREENRDFSRAEAGRHSAAELAYFEHYGLHFDGAAHTFGMVTVGSWRIAGHRFQPEHIRGVVLIVHGYYDHTATWRHVIHDLLENDYAVIIYDQPGHGLSSGDAAAIDSFDRYREVLTHFDAWTHAQYAMPVHLLAHSMGAGAVIDYLCTEKGERTGKVILLAPLIRSVAWEISGVGFNAVGSHFDSVPRKFRKNCSNRAYLKFAKKQDPLQARQVPSSWVKSHRDWVNRMQEAQGSHQAISILQGSKDTTVANTYNIPFIRERFPNTRLQVIKKAGHQLMNEKPDLREPLLKMILAILMSPDS